MASEKHVLYREAQPDLEYIFETEGWENVSRGVENMVIDRMECCMGEEEGAEEGEGEGEGIGSDLAVEDLMFDELGFEVD